MCALGLLVALLALCALGARGVPCQTDSDCPTIAWCTGVARCNTAYKTCEMRPRCTNPATPYCDPVARTCASVLPKIQPSPPPGSSEISMLAMSGGACFNVSCCISQIRAAYRYTLPPASRLPWCITNVTVSSGGTGCEITARCAANEICNSSARSCSDAPVTIAQSDVALCVTNGDCNSTNFCQGTWTCGPENTCVPPNEPPCAGNTSFPYCNQNTQRCEPAPTYGINFPLWVIIVVIATVLCFVLCVAVLCTINGERGYDLSEREQYMMTMTTTAAAANFRAALIGSPLRAVDGTHNR